MQLAAILLLMVALPIFSFAQEVSSNQVAWVEALGKWWVPALALSGSIFFGLAGIQHVRNQASTRPEVAAMVSNLGMAAVLLVYLLGLGLRAL